MKNTCETCIHFGKIKDPSGMIGRGVYVCLAPITTDPPPNGMTAAKHRFVYSIMAHCLCELYTQDKENIAGSPDLP